MKKKNLLKIMSLIERVQEDVATRPDIFVREVLFLFLFLKRDVCGNRYCSNVIVCIQKVIFALKVSLIVVFILQSTLTKLRLLR